MTSIYIAYRSKWRRNLFGNKYAFSQGELDVDMNVESYESLEPVENIYWPENEAPIGVYRVFVHTIKIINVATIAKTLPRYL